jgi:hypothetical protein
MTLLGDSGGGFLFVVPFSTSDQLDECSEAIAALNTFKARQKSDYVQSIN